MNKIFIALLTFAAGLCARPVTTQEQQQMADTAYSQQAAWESVATEYSQETLNYAYFSGLAFGSLDAGNGVWYFYDSQDYSDMLLVARDISYGWAVAAGPGWEREYYYGCGDAYGAQAYYAAIF